MRPKNSLAQANGGRRLKKGKLYVALLIAAILGLLFGVAAHAQAPAVSPFMGIGNVQFTDNIGAPLTSGVLYTYAAGTTTQQSTYTDSTGLVLNPDPVPFTSGARASIWLLSGSFYKFVLCAQNDGATCAPADVLFSQDNVPGSPTAGSNIGTASQLITGSPNPATTGVIRFASGDQLCWRNAANSANLCISKDANDILTWDGGSMKFPQISAPTGVANFDLLWADLANNRWAMSNNGAAADLIVGQNTTDTLQNKTIVSPVINGAPTGNAIQGTNTHLLSAGTVSGPAGSQLCTSTSGGATTAGCIPPTVITATSRNTLASDISLTSGTATTVLSQVVTMPNSGCPCRIQVSYGIYLTTNNQTFDAWVTDGTNVMASSQITGSGTNTTGMSAQELSQTTYANSAAPTLTLKIEDNGTGGTVKALPATGSGTNTWFTTTILTSN